VVLYSFKATDGDQIPERLRISLRAQRGHEVANDGIWYSRGCRLPVQQRIPRPSGDAHQTVNLRDHLQLDPPNRSEYGPVTLDVLLIGPFVGLGDPEVNGHYYALVGSSPRTQGCPSGQRSLDVNDAVVSLGEAATQRDAEEHLVPMTKPDDTSGSADSL